MHMVHNEIHDIKFITAFVIHFTVSGDVEHVEENGEIKGILSGGSELGTRIVWIKDMLFCEKKGWYQLNDIKHVTTLENGDNVYRSLTMQRSDTSMMILPFIGGSRNELCYSDHMMNAFLYREGYDKEDRIWVLMRRPLHKDLYYNKAITILRTCEEFISEEFIGSEYQMFTLRLPEEFEDDINMIKQSKFSKISESGKRRILAFHNIQNDKNKLKMQLYKNSILRKKLEKDLQVRISSDAELRSLVNMDRETFKDEYIIEASRECI